MNRKVLAASGAVVLGALGSGLWELAKPALGWGFDAAVTVSTLGLASLRDGLYAQAALSLGRPIGLGSAVQGLAAFMCIVGAIVVRVLALGLDPQRGRTAFRFALLLVVGATVMLLAAIRTSYATRLAGIYEELEVIAAPFLTDLELRQYRSQFARVATRDDYAMVIDALTARIEGAGQRAPKR